MRILHFINNIELSWYNMLVDTVRAQQKRGHEVTVVFPPQGKNYKRLVSDGIPAVALPVRSSKFDYFAALKLAQIIRARKVDILHAHLTSSALLGSAAARLAGVPCVASVLKMTKKRRYMKCDALLPCSGAVLEDLLSQGVPPGMMRRVYTGVDIGRITAGRGSSEKPRAEFGYSPEHKVIASIARLAPMKGHTHLLDAMKIVSARRPEARLLIVGDGELRGELEQKTDALGLRGRVAFAGTRLDLANVLNAIDISTLASVDKEGLPVILVESCLFEKPAVMTDVAGIREIIRRGETGYIAPPRDPAALAGALCRAIENPEEASRMAANAAAFVRREFDVNNTTAQMDEVYESLLKNRK